MQKIYTHTKFSGHYPVGTAAVVVASSKTEAVQLLNNRLRSEGLPGDATIDGFVEVDPTKRTVRLLRDGNY